MVLVIHRTAYADVTLPKGKVDPGETLAETAVREVFEETGIRVRLGIPVGVSHYRMPSKRQKIVHYWAAEATDDAIRASAFVPNKEIAALEWVTPEARARLPELSGRRGDPRELPAIRRRRRAADLPDHRPPARQGGRTRGLEGRGCRAAADRARDASRPAVIVGPLRAFGVRKIISSTGGALRHDRDAPRRRRSAAPSSAPTRSARTPGRRAHPTCARSSASACAPARPPCSAATARCCPTSSTRSRSPPGTLRGSYLGSAAALETGAFSVVHLSATNPGSGIVAIETHEPRE